MPEKIKQMRDLQTAMVNGLETRGYYTFANGNAISGYIYVKAVNVADLGMTKMLTTQCGIAESDPAYPVKFPSWRGNYDLWPAYTAITGNRNMAIQGLFKYIDPAGAEAKALETAGYKNIHWMAFQTIKYPVNFLAGYLIRLYNVLYG